MSHLNMIHISEFWEIISINDNTDFYPESMKPLRYVKSKNHDASYDMELAKFQIRNLFKSYNGIRHLSSWQI